MKTNRRDFLKTLVGIAAFTIVPRHVLGNGFIAPSDQLTKGIIGTGGMGRGHVDYAGTRLVAVCDVDKNHLELGKQLVKDKIAAYHDFRDLILDPNVDIVHIATPLRCANGDFSCDLCGKIRIFRCIRVVFGDFVIMVLSHYFNYSMTVLFFLTLFSQVYFYNIYPLNFPLYLVSFLPTKHHFL